jgi:hypothetical protein
VTRHFTWSFVEIARNRIAAVTLKGIIAALADLN